MLVGLDGQQGGFAEQCVVDARWAHPLGDIPTDLGALVEPLAVAYHAVRLSGIKPGGTAAVFGSGPIGLVTTAALKAAGLLARAIYVERGTMAGERILPLAEVGDEEAPYFSLIIVPGEGRRV